MRDKSGREYEASVRIVGERMTLYCGDAVYYLEIHQRDPKKHHLLLMHGFMGSSKGFASLISRLKPIWNPVSIDLAGHGCSDMPAEFDRFKTESQIRDLTSILNRLQLDNLWLYGYSMGGRLAQNLYIASPGRFAGLILESTHCGISDESERQQRQIIDEERANAIESDFDAFVDKWSMLPLFKSPSGARDFDYKTVIKQQNPALMAASLRGFGAGKAPFLCDRLATADKPIALIAGDADKKYVDKMREMHHLFPDSELLVADSAGHRVHADQPEQITSFLTNFLNKYG